MDAPASFKKAYALFRADALSQRSCHSDFRGVLTPLRPHVRTGHKLIQPLASKLAWSLSL